MMLCKAVAMRNGGQQCKQLASVDTDGDGEPDACYIRAHQEQVRRGAAGEAPAPAATAPAPAPEEAAPLAALEALPIAQDDPAAEVAQTVVQEAVAAAAPDDLDALAARLLGDVPQDAAEADRVGRERADQDTPPLRQQIGVVGVVNAADKFRPERVKFYLRVVFNGKLKAAGKEPLNDEELQEGAEAISDALLDMLGPVAVTNPYARAGLWVAAVIGVRYADELIDWCAARFFPSRRRAIASTTPAPVEATSEPAPDPRAAAENVAASSWGNLQ